MGFKDRLGKLVAGGILLAVLAGSGFLYYRLCSKLTPTLPTRESLRKNPENVRIYEYQKSPSYLKSQFVGEGAFEDHYIFFDNAAKRVVAITYTGTPPYPAKWVVSGHVPGKDANYSVNEGKFFIKKTKVMPKKLEGIASSLYHSLPEYRYAASMAAWNASQYLGNKPHVPNNDPVYSAPMKCKNLEMYTRINAAMDIDLNSLGAGIAILLDFDIDGSVDAISTPQTGKIAYIRPGFTMKDDPFFKTKEGETEFMNPLLQRAASDLKMDIQAFREEVIDTRKNE